MESKIENCLYMQVAHCNKCGGQSGYNIVDGEKVCFDCGEPYEADFSVSKVESTITTTNSQDQEEDILKDTKLFSSWVHNGREWKEYIPEEWVCPKCGFDDCHPYRNSEDFGLMYCPECNELVKLLNNK